MKMRTLKSRLMAGLLCLVMVLTLLPASALAVGEDEAASATQTGDTDTSTTPTDDTDTSATPTDDTDTSATPTDDEDTPATPTDDTDAPATPTQSASTPTTPMEEYVPAEPQDAATVQAMIDALPDAEELADMTAEELETVYAQAAEAYTLFELLNAEEMQSITGVEKIAALMDALTAAMEALAEAEPTAQISGDFRFKNNSDGSGFIITGLTDAGKAKEELTIPDELTGNVTVTYKDDEDEDVTETTEDVTLPVVEVGGAALRNADKLKKLTLGKNIRVIGNNAIAVYNVNETFTSVLEEVVIPADSALEEIGHSAFQNNKKLTRIGIVGADGTATLPAGLTYIGGYAFYGCTGLTAIHFDTSEDVALKTIGDSTFACSGLTSVTMPDSVEILGHNAFAACPKLTHITVSENLDFMGIWGFANNAKLESVTFKGRYPLKAFGLGGFENYLTFEGVNKDCIVYVPQPANDGEYANVLDSVYSPGRGAAVPTVRLLWWDNEGATAKTAPGTPSVTEASLNTLDTQNFKKNGISVEKNKDGCAAVITVKEGSGLTATLKAALPTGSDGSVYWVTVEAFVNRTADIKASGGTALTNGMYDFVYRRGGGGGGSSINLDTTGKRGRTVFYFPVATNYGSKDAPERSAVGVPVKVMYVADQAQPSVVGTGNKFVYVGNEMPTQDTVYIDKNGTRTPINAWEASAPMKVYLTDDAEDTGAINNYEMRAEVMVPGFEALIPDSAKDENGELIENVTLATNYKSNSGNDGASIEFQWRIAYDKDTALDSYEHLNYQSTQGTAVYGGMGHNGLCWRIGRPSNETLNRVLKPGMNFLYADITVKQNGKTTTLKTGITEFYCFGDDFKVTLTSDDWNEANIEENYLDDWLTTIKETGVTGGEERVLTVVLNKDEVISPEGSSMTRLQKIARYQAMFEACFERVTGTFYYRNVYNNGGDAKSFSTTGRSFAVPTEKLGTSVSYTNSDTGEEVTYEVNHIDLGYGGNGAMVHLKFGDKTQSGVIFRTPVYSCVHGDSSVNSTILTFSPERWAKTEGTPESPAWDYDVFWLYLNGFKMSGVTWEGNEWSSGAYVAELYEVDAPDQTRGGTRVLASNDETFDSIGQFDTIQDVSDYDPTGDPIRTYKAVRLELWGGDVRDAEEGIHYYYWRVYKASTPSVAEYSPVFARFVSRKTGASASITTGQKEATFLANTLELPFVLRGVNVTANILAGNYVAATGNLQLQYKSGNNTWTTITGWPDNYGWSKDEDAPANASTIVSGDSLFTTVPYTLTLHKTFTKSTTEKYNFFDEYDTDGDGTVTLRLACIAKAYGIEVYSETFTVTNADRDTVPTVTLITSATLDGEALSHGITRSTEYERDKNGVPKRDENGDYILCNLSPVILTAKAQCWEGKYATVTWDVMYRGEVVKTLTADDLDSETPLTIGGTTFKITGYTENLIRSQRGDDTYENTLTLEISAPINDYTYSFTLTPRAEVSRTTGYSSITGTATAPFYTLTHNPAAYAADPSIYTHPASVNVRPGENVTPPTLTAVAHPTMDGGALTWQWYSTTSANSTTGGTKVDGASGSGTEASYTLPASQLKNVGMYYYYCKFTNTNPSVTGNSKSSSRNTNIARVNVSEGLVELEDPIISAGITDYTFQWANLDQLSSYARWLVVKQPAALKGAEPTWVSFPTPRQSKVDLELYVEKQVDGEWQQVNSTSNADGYVLRDGFTRYKSSTQSSGLECAMIGDYYYYSSKNLDSYLRLSYTHLGIAKEEPVRFRLEWTVTNVLDRGSDSEFPTPTNLTGGMETTATSTVYIVRQPMEVPTFWEYSLAYDDEEDGGIEMSTADFRFEEGVPVEKSTASVTLDGKTYTDFPVFQISNRNGNEDYRELSVWPQLKSRLGQVNAELQRWRDDASYTTWWYSSRMNNCSKTRPSAFSVGVNSRGSDDTSPISYFRIQLENEENNITSAAAYSGIFGVKWVEPEDAATPVPPESLDTSTKKWYYQLNEGSPESVSLTLGSDDLWTAGDNVPTYAWSYSYTDKDGTYHKETITGETGTSLTLLTETPLMNELVAAMKAKTSGRYVNFTITATNYDPSVTGNRTATVSKSIPVEFKPRLSPPQVSIVTPAKTTVSTGETISLSLNIQNKAQIEAEGGTLSYYWHYQFVSVTDAKGPLADRVYTAGLGGNERASATTLKTMGDYTALYYDYKTDESGSSGSERFNSTWWAAHPDAQVKLKIFCEVTNKKDYDSDGGFYYDTEEVTTAPLEITITRPTFNQGLKVTTYDADGAQVSETTDPTTDVIVPKNGRVVFTMPQGEIYGTPDWFQQLAGAETYGYVYGSADDTDWQKTISYAQMCEDGVFKPHDVWARVTAKVNSRWTMDTVKVRLVSNDVPTPEITNMPEAKFADPNGNVGLVPTVTVTGGTLSYQWYVKENGEWKTGEGSAWTGSSLDVTMPDGINVSREFKLRVTNTMAGKDPVTVEKTCTVTTRGVTLALPATMPEAVSGRAYDLPLSFTWVGETLADGEVTWSGIPNDYTVVKRTDGYHLVNEDPTALDATLTVTVSPSGLGGKEYTAGVELDITVSEPPAGVKVSGQVKSYDPKNATTVTLYAATDTTHATPLYTATITAEATGSGQKEQSFKLTGVAAGTYDLVVTKSCHLTYTIKNVVVGTSDLDLTADSTKPYSTITLLAGDVNGDGSITEGDVTTIRLAANINKSTSDANNKLADVNGDGSVLESDVTTVRLAAHINKSAASHCTHNY